MARSLSRYREFHGEGLSRKEIGNIARQVRENYWKKFGKITKQKKKLIP